MKKKVNKKNTDKVFNEVRKFVKKNPNATQKEICKYGAEMMNTVFKKT